MHRVNTTLLTLLLVVGLASVAAASSVRLKDNELRFTDDGLTLTVRGALTGLGGGDLVGALSASGTTTHELAHLTWQCHDSFQSHEELLPYISNGTTSFSLTTDPPVTDTPDCQIDVQNVNGIATTVDVAFTGAVLTVKEQGRVVLTVTCEFVPASADGPLTTPNFQCTEAYVD